MNGWMDYMGEYSNSGLFFTELIIRVRHVFQESNSLSVESPLSFLSKKGNDSPLLAANRGIVPTKFFSTHIQKPHTHGQEPRNSNNGLKFPLTGMNTLVTCRTLNLILYHCLHLIHHCYWASTEEGIFPTILCAFTNYINTYFIKESVDKDINTIILKMLYICKFYLEKILRHKRCKSYK